MKKLLQHWKSVPRWVVLIIDLALNTLSFVLAYFVVQRFDFPEMLRGHFFVYTGLYGVTSLVVFYLMRVHTCLIRHSNIRDMLRIFTTVLYTSIVYLVLVKIVAERTYHIHSLNIWWTLLINFFVSSSLLVMLRTAVKGTYFYIKRINSSEVERVLIYGSDRNSVVIKHALHSGDGNFFISGFLEPGGKNINSFIEQIKIFGVKDLPILRHKHNVEKMILRSEFLHEAENRGIIKQCLELGIKVLTVPPSDQWVSGNLSMNQIKDLKIEDLLQRDPIVISNTKITSELEGKRILVTGAAGSIGSEIVRQILKYSPKMVILTDQAESPLHEVLLEIQEKYPDANIKAFIGSIRDHNRMFNAFKDHKPQIIFHAAAYKHVPMMEDHPVEAILTNVGGTKNIADLAVMFEAEKFVMISTDKAVNPTNVMGTSKRIAELYIQSMNITQESVFDIDQDNNFLLKAPVYSNTKFITTRFGNVLDSNGSVIPRFRSQIKKGGPLTVTDPEITRFFMTIPEAVQLVLEAGTMGNGGEIYVFDMGKPVKIIDLALKMIQLAGLTPEKDIKVVFTGLRPGEKLYEELLNEKEKTLPTHHEKIKIAKVMTCSFSKILNEIQELISITENEDHYSLVRKMKEMVPEFKSNNSVYEQLDAASAPGQVLQTAG